MIGCYRRSSLGSLRFQKNDKTMNVDLVDVVDDNVGYEKRKRSIEEVEVGELSIIKGLLLWKRQRKNVHVPTV